MKKYSFLILVLLSIGANAQKIKTVTNYYNVEPIDSTAWGDNKVYILENRTEKLRFIFQINPIDIDAGSTDVFTWNIGAGADYFYQKYFSIHSSYSYSWLDINKLYSLGIENKGENVLNNLNKFEIGGRINIIDKPGRKNGKIILESHSYGRSTVRFYITPELPCRQVIAIRGGYFSNTIIVNTDMNKNELKVGDAGAVKTTDGSVFYGTYYTNSYTNGIYIGISSMTFMNLITKYDDKKFKGNIYKNKLFKELYADILFGNTSFDPFISGGLPFDIKPNEKGSFQTTSIGGRIGIILDGGSKRTTNFKFETGYRPSIAGSGFYVAISGGIAIMKSKKQ